MSGTTAQPGADSSAGADFTYIVLSAAPGRQARDVLRDYLSMDWVRGTPTATARTQDGRAITAGDLSLPGAPDAPPVLTFENPPGSVPKSQLVVLRASAPQVLARAARLPRLPGETLTRRKPRRAGFQMVLVFCSKGKKINGIFWLCMCFECPSADIESGTPV